MDENDSSDSDYLVEEYVRPAKIRKALVNDDSADILGNFDDAKRKKLMDPSMYNNEEEGQSNYDEDENVANDTINGENPEGDEENAAEEGNNSPTNDDASEEEDENGTDEINTKLSKDQVEELRRGASKKNRYVIYVTNLNFDSTKDDLENFFENAGEVKGVRIPRRRRGGFAFVEMSTIEGFQKALQFHNTELHGRKIKIQVSEGGKKKSANKKNILKQKNRKLAEMRNEKKSFTKSGKNYDKNLKKEIAKEMVAKKRWRKNPKKLTIAAWK